MGWEAATVPRQLFSVQQEGPSLSTPIGDRDPVRVRARFGSYRGLIRLLLGYFENGIGGYRRLKKIRWDRVERVVFVCHGNICRSPYAERRDATYGLPTASFGLSAETGRPADPSALRVAARRAIWLAEHRACAARDFEFHGGDLLIVMEPRLARAMSADGALSIDLAWPVEPDSSPAHPRPAPFVRSILGAMLRRHRFRCTGHCRADTSEPARWEIGRRTRRLSYWVRIPRSASQSFAI